MELWNALTWKPITLFGPFKENDVGDLLTMCWHSSGEQFITTHKDGTIAFWNLNETSKPFKLQRVHGKFYKHILHGKAYTQQVYI